MPIFSHGPTLRSLSSDDFISETLAQIAGEAQRVRVSLGAKACGSAGEGESRVCGIFGRFSLFIVSCIVQCFVY